MYNYSYNEYMNNLLGYNTQMNRNSIYNNMIEPYENENFFTYQQTDKELEDCYPDIYKMVYPMVCKACLYINEEITPDLVERITNDIYENLEQEENPNENRNEEIKMNYNNIQNSKNIKQTSKNTQIENTKTEKRQRNFLLNDLIRILVLRELIGSGRRPPRHMFPQRPPIQPRPPIQGGNFPPPPRPRNDNLIF